jgi:hypothetical protein
MAPPVGTESENTEGLPHQGIVSGDVFSPGSPRVFEKLLKNEYDWASHYRHAPMAKAAYTKKKHRDVILNWARQKKSSGILTEYNRNSKPQRPRPENEHDSMPSMPQLVSIYIKSVV